MTFQPQSVAFIRKLHKTDKKHVGQDITVSIITSIVALVHLNTVTMITFCSTMIMCLCYHCNCKGAVPFSFV